MESVPEVQRMKKNLPGQNPAESLHPRAEALLRKTPMELAALPPAAVQKLVQELQAHQIELELQNEALRRTEAALEAEKEHFASFYQLAAAGFATLNEQGVIRKVNRTLATLLGVAPDALIHHPFTRFVFKDDQDIYYLFRRQLSEAAAAPACELRMVNARGTTFWAHLAATGARAEDGAPIVRLVLSDIDMRKQAELAASALLESERHYRDLFEHMNEGFALCRMMFEDRRPVDFVYLVVNEKFTELTGLKDVAGKRASEILPGLRESDPELLEVFGRVAANGKPEKAERFIEALQMWFELSIYSTEQDQFVVVFDVINERKRILTRLEATARELVEAQRLAALGSYVFELRSGRWTSSEVMDELFGIADPDYPRDVAGWLQIVHPDDRAELQHYWEQEVLRDHANFDRVYRILRQNDRQERWVHGRGKLVLDGAGRVLQMAGIIQDITESRRADEALQRSQERYALAERAVDDGLWDWNILSDEEYFSPRWKAILGYHGTELIGHKSAFLELVHPDDRTAVHEVTRGHLEQGLRYAAEFRLRHKDGSYRWVFSRGDAMRDAAGRPVRMIGATTDITERKHTEEAMRESEERYRRLFTVTTDAVMQVDWETNQILEANPAAEKMYGYSREEFLQLRAADVSAEPEKTRHAIASAEMQVPLRLHRRKDGTDFPVEISCGYSEFQHRRIHVAVMRDITERQRAAAALQGSERLLRTVMDLVPHFIFVKDAQSRHLLVNRVCAAANGLTPEQMVGMSDLDCVPDRAQAEAFMRDDQEVIASDKPKFIVEERFTNAAGQLRILQTTKIPFTAPGIDGKALMGVVVDITDLKQAEMALRESEEKFAKMFDSSPVATTLSTLKDGRLLDVNASFLTMFQ